MAAGGIERLSPIIRNSSVRRLSLDLCQKLGTQLLSPNLVVSSQKSQDGRKTSISTPTKESLFTRNFQIDSSTGSPKILVNENTGYIPRRRCSDSYSHFYSITNVSENSSLSSPQRFNPTRRKSLTPLNLNCQNLLQGFQSPVLGNAKINLAISPIPPSPTSPSCEPNNANTKDANIDIIDIKDINNSSPEERKSKIACNVIPPTPLGKGHEGSDNKASSSEDEGKVFASPNAKQDISSVPIRPRRCSIARAIHGPSRRKSSTTRYDFDDEFLKFVLLRCKLHLSPEHILGRGGFGTVVAGTYRGKPVAVKVIKTKSEKKLESMKGEENALSLPPHPHITKHIEIVQIQPEKFLVVLEKLQKGNLLAVINDPEVQLDIRRVIQISLEIASALDFCHLHGILHLDVKPQNVLLDLHGSVKLSDFGNSKRISELRNRMDFTKLDGTVAYKAPELFRGACPTTKSDVFSLAISMWHILTREMPYMSETEHSVIYKVVAQKLRPKAVCTFINPFTKESKPQRDSSILMDFIKLYEVSWESCPELRPSMTGIIERLSQLQMKFKCSILNAYEL